MSSWRWPNVLWFFFSVSLQLSWGNNVLAKIKYKYDNQKCNLFCPGTNRVQGIGLRLCCIHNSLHVKAQPQASSSGTAVHCTREETPARSRYKCSRRILIQLLCIKHSIRLLTGFSRFQLRNCRLQEPLSLHLLLFNCRWPLSSSNLNPSINSNKI